MFTLKIRNSLRDGRIYTSLDTKKDLNSGTVEIEDGIHLASVRQNKSLLLLSAHHGTLKRLPVMLNFLITSWDLNRSSWTLYEVAI